MKHPKDPYRKFEACVFCGGAADSREHIISKWVGKKLGELPNARTEFHVRDGERIIEKVELKASSPITGLTSRSVCRTCNSGWMSQVEDGAKPILNALIDGTFKGLISIHDQCALLKYFSIKAMMVDIENTSAGSVLSASERSRFPTSFRLEEFKLFIGKFSLFARDPYLNTAFARALAVNKISGQKKELKVFGKRISMAIGRLVAVSDLGNYPEKLPPGFRQVEGVKELKFPPPIRINVSRLERTAYIDKITGYKPVSYDYGHPEREKRLKS